MPELLSVTLQRGRLRYAYYHVLGMLAGAGGYGLFGNGGAALLLLWWWSWRFRSEQSTFVLIRSQVRSMWLTPWLVVISTGFFEPKMIYCDELAADELAMIRRTVKYWLSKPRNE